MTSILASKADRLIAASEKHSYDPFSEIDWDRPIDDSAYHLPPEELPLYGTPQWDAMSEQERMTYSRHECAALCSAGIWFEGILMRFLLDHLYDMPATDPTHRYLLIETADECRHSAMFGEYVRRAGTPAYQVHPALRFAGRVLKATAGGPEAFIAVLAAEELLDASNRLTMRDARVHPTSAHMARLHVLEEARHVSFARTYLEQVWPTLSRRAKLRARIVAPFACFSIAMAVSNPAVYRTLGIDGGYRTARRNPHHRDRIRQGLGKLTDHLTGLGVINRRWRPVWARFGLLAES
jgi:hypothetical protein